MASKVEQIGELNGRILAYKQRLAAPDIAALSEQREMLTITKNRFSAEVLKLIDGLDAAKTQLRTAERAREAARTELDHLMAATLLTFQDAINGWLRSFSAPFEIDSLGSTHLGGGLRSEYVLKIRGARVVIGPKTTGDLSFHAALSEGDKRTLAFAFFLARLFADPKRTETTVVLDDVFTSLDRHRRHNTVEAVLKMVAECSQVIALGHDAHFLREVKRRVERKKLRLPANTLSIAMLKSTATWTALIWMHTVHRITTSTISLLSASSQGIKLAACLKWRRLCACW